MKLDAAAIWELGHLDVCTGCNCDFSRVNPYRAHKQGVTVSLPADRVDREAVIALWREEGWKQP